MANSDPTLNQEPSDVLAIREQPQIDAAQVLSVFENGDLEAKGALFQFLEEESFWNRIAPAIAHELLDRCYVGYLEQCVIEGRESDWCHSRYLACADLNQMVSEQLGWGEPVAVAAALGLLERLYRHPDSAVKTAVVNGCLEHLFEDEAIRAHFEGWRADPELAMAYDRAMAWQRRTKADHNRASQ